MYLDAVVSFLISEEFSCSFYKGFMFLCFFQLFFGVQQKIISEVFGWGLVSW